MEEKIVKLSSGKEFTVKEIKYKDFAENIAEGKENSTKFLLKISTGMSDEDYEQLSMKDGVLLQKVINEINGLDNSFLQETPLELK